MPIKLLLAITKPNVTSYKPLKNHNNTTITTTDDGNSDNKAISVQLGKKQNSVQKIWFEKFYRNRKILVKKDRSKQFWSKTFLVNRRN